MKLSAAFSLFTDLRFAVQTALWPTIVSIWYNPYLLFNPQELSRTFMNHVWLVFGNGVDENGRPVKTQLITPHATGVVLDLGAGAEPSDPLLVLRTRRSDAGWLGYGHTVNYLNHSKIAKYVALEPNVNMHDQIRLNASKAGYTESAGNLVILSCGAEDSKTILETLDYTQVDTIISVLTLCTVPNPQLTIQRLVLDVLKPGGTLLFYEHVLSPRKDVAWWQRFWAPLWAIGFDGCRMDRPSHLYVEEIKGWEGESEVWKQRSVWGKQGEDEENLFWHRAGRYVKA
ncbi:hypothetical protein NP233_g4198 [Leucocoprinus birnbaumii]|uniref:Methyltransferase type 11 domain-containing protein n=1 Tax=Leucocoprinus birnbaumii TaxID=56174 RepID=A0AAD5YVR0_9AGAR|nr:hypothetical protein NP233_g4198 [Leucocoprinus birnbaumii]